MKEEASLAFNLYPYSEEMNELTENEEKEKSNYPSLRESFAYLGIMVLMNLGIGILLEMLNQEVGLYRPFNVLAGYVIAFGLALAYGLNRRGSNYFPFKKIPLFVYLVLIPVTLSIITIVEPLINLIPMPEEVRKMFEEALQDPIFSFITVVIAAPFLEEFIFRGIIFGGLIKRFAPGKAILWSSVIFGMAHLNPWQFIGAFAVGVLLAWVYWKTESIIPCIFIHFITNLSGYLVSFLADDSMATLQDFVANDMVYFSLYAGSFVVAAGGYFLLNKIFSRQEVLQ